jgi:3-hydroxyisobutyrate dehydrogenase-like beta-hydroxyacid dehydrogenase
MARIGMIGVGNIGGAVAANLVADGHDVTVTDADKARAVAIEGAAAVASVAAVAEKAEITITSLPSPDVLATVAEEWSGAAAAGSILLDISTMSPERNRALAEQLAAKGQHFVEAPLTGGAPGAAQRTLVFMVGGEPEPVDRCRPILDKLGRATFHLGPVGTGSTMKLVNSLLAFTCTWVSLEGLSLAANAGLDLRDAVQVIRTGGASNFFIDRAVEGINERGRPPQFSLALAAKDADLIAQLAADLGIPAPVAGAVAEVFRDAIERGLGANDWSDLVLMAEARGGVDLRLRPASD